MPIKQVRINPLSAIVCDQIRTEDTGKKIIIGVYTGDIIVDRPPPDIPSPVLPLSFLLTVSVSAAGDANILFEVRGPGENKKIGLKGLAHFEGEDRLLKRAHIEFNGVPVSLESEGPITLYFKHEDDEDWEEVYSINLLFREDSQKI